MAIKKEITEQQVQSKLIKELEKKGYFVLKLVRTNKNGIPDIVAFPPNSDAIFFEVKRPGGQASALQKYRIEELAKHGIKAEVYDGSKTQD